MITEAFLKILSALLDWLVSIRPTWDIHLPSAVGDFVATVMAYNDIVPVGEVMLIVSLSVGAMLALQLWKWTVKLVDWIADVIP